MAAREQHGGGDGPGAGPEDRDVGPDEAASAQVGQLGPARARGSRVRSPPSVAERTTTVLPPAHAVCTPGSSASGSVVAPSLKRHTPTLGRIVDRVAVNRTRPVHAGHEREREVGRRERHAAGDEPAGPLVFGGHDEPAVVQPRRARRPRARPRPRRCPRRGWWSDVARPVAIACSRVGRQHLELALVPALDREHDPVGLRPIDVGQVRETRRGPTRSRRRRPSRPRTKRVTSALAVPAAG